MASAACSLPPPPPPLQRKSVPSSKPPTVSAFEGEKTKSGSVQQQPEEEKAEGVRVVVFHPLDKRLGPDRDLSSLITFGPLQLDRATKTQSCGIYLCLKKSRIKGEKLARVAIQVHGTNLQPTPSSPHSLPGAYHPLYLSVKASGVDSDMETRAIQERLVCLERRLMEALRNHLLKEGMSEESIQERTYQGLCRYVPLRASRSTLASTSTSRNSEPTTCGDVRRVVPILCTRYRASHLDDGAVYSTSSDKQQLASFERRSSPVLSSGTDVDLTSLFSHVTITKHAITWMQTAVRLLPPGPAKP